MLSDLLQIALQRGCDIVDFGAQAVCDGKFVRRHRLIQLIQQIDRQIGEVVDEIKRVLDLVRDAGRQLPQRRHLLGLHQPVLGAAQIGQRDLGSGARTMRFLEQLRVLDREHSLPREGLQQSGDARLTMLSVIPPECTRVGAAQPVRPLQDCLEQASGIARGAVDDAEDLSQHGLAGHRRVAFPSQFRDYAVRILCRGVLRRGHVFPCWPGSSHIDRQPARRVAVARRLSNLYPTVDERCQSPLAGYL